MPNYMSLDDAVLCPPGPARKDRKRLHLVGVHDDRLFCQRPLQSLVMGVYVLHGSKIKSPSAPVTLRVTGLLKDGRGYVDIKVTGGLKAIGNIRYCDEPDACIAPGWEEIMAKKQGRKKDA